MGQKNDLAKFGQSFQEKLVRLIIRDKDFADQIGEVIRLEHFSTKHLREVTKMVYHLKKEYDVHPSYDAVSSYAKSELEKYPEALQKNIASFLMSGIDQKIEDESFIKDKSLDFCKRRAVQNALIEALELAEDSNYDQLRKRVESALKLGADNDLGYHYLDDISDRYGGKDRLTIPTGQPVLDRLLKGGWGRKEFHVLIAPTNAGKTGFLAYSIARCLLDGKTVALFTFEEPSKKYAKRIDASISGIELNDLDNNFEKVQNNLSELPGRLIIKEYPIRGATVGTIRNHIEKLKARDIFPDIIFVDYADLIRPANRFEQSRHGYQEVYEDLRGLAMEYDVPVVTATQTNRTGVEIEVVTMEHIAEAFSKCWNADFIITLSNRRNLFVAKNRNGPKDDVYPMDIDHGKVKYVIEDRRITELLTGSSKNEADKSLIKKLMQMNKEGSL